MEVALRESRAIAAAADSEIEAEQREMQDTALRTKLPWLERCPMYRGGNCLLDCFKGGLVRLGLIREGLFATGVLYLKECLIL